MRKRDNVMRNAIAALLILFFASASAYAAGNEVSRYVVTLSGAAAADDAPAVADALAAQYGGRLEFYAEDSFRGFAIVVTEERARLLSVDPRVAKVEPRSFSTQTATPAVTEPIAAEAVSTLWTSSPSAWESGAYVYDAAGNITAIGDDHYSYDKAGRLLTATTLGTASKQYAQTFQYDRYGNLLVATKTTAGMPPEIVVNDVNPETNRLGNGNYDQAGNQRRNVLAVPEITYAWDELGMMQVLYEAGGATDQYVYDANDERVLVVRGNERRYSLRGLDNKVLRDFVEENGAWRIEHDYVYRDATLLASFDSGDPTAPPARHFHVDHLGTPRLVTDALAATAGVHSYFPFGSEATIPEFSERLKFTGHERDFAGSAAKDMDYMHARYYAPGTGRFLSVDPVNKSAVLQEPQTFNRYAYVVNNPLNKTDPDGRKDGEVFGPTAFDRRRLIFAQMRAFNREHMPQYKILAEANEARRDMLSGVKEVGVGLTTPAEMSKAKLFATFSVKNPGTDDDLVLTAGATSGPVAQSAGNLDLGESFPSTADAESSEFDQTELAVPVAGVLVVTLKIDVIEWIDDADARERYDEKMDQFLRTGPQDVSVAPPRERVSIWSRIVSFFGW